MAQSSIEDKLLQRIAHCISTDDEFETYFSSHYSLSADVNDETQKLVYNLASHFAQDADSWSKFKELVQLHKSTGE